MWLLANTTLDKQSCFFISIFAFFLPNDESTTISIQMNYFVLWSSVYPGKYLLEIKGLRCFDFQLFRVWPWPLNIGGHPIDLKSEIFLSFESQYKIPYITSIDTPSLSRIVYNIFWLKVFRVWPWRLTFGNHLKSKCFWSIENHTWLPIFDWLFLSIL